MSVSDQPEWKRKALVLWPDLQDYLGEDDTIYVLFWELLARCREAHQRRDERRLDRIYDYAEWCLGQPEKDVWNAAGVAFYEHLVDEPETQETIPKWLTPDVYREVEGLFRSRLDAGEFARLESSYRERHPDTA